jgi:DNA-binding NtrC family response regulator
MPRLTSPPRVLVVDDDRTVCEFLGDCLRRRDSGCVVETAGTGAGAIDAVHRRRPDLVLLDIALPDLSGLDVLRLIRQLNPGLPVIIITGARDPRAAVEAHAKRRLRAHPEAVQHDLRREPRRGRAGGGLTAARPAARPHTTPPSRSRRTSAPP